MGLPKKFQMPIQTEMLQALKEILAAPFKDWSIWWLLGPVLILWTILEIYCPLQRQAEPFSEGKGSQTPWMWSILREQAQC